MSSTTSNTMIHQEDLIDTLLRYGLLVGAAFQLFCIGAVLLMPDTSKETTNDSDSSDDEMLSSDPGSPSHQHHISPNRHQHKKRERKKRR